MISIIHMKRHIDCDGRETKHLVNRMAGSDEVILDFGGVNDEQLVMNQIIGAIAAVNVKKLLVANTSDSIESQMRGSILRPPARIRDLSEYLIQNK